jgi:tRNA dimethylallyltransferase
MWHFLDGQMSHDEMIERGIIATRQLAKRQLTWLRGWPGLHTLDTSQADSTDYCQQILSQL